MKQTSLTRALVFGLCAVGSLAVSLVLVPSQLLHYTVIYLSYPNVLLMFLLLGLGLFKLQTKEAALSRLLPRRASALLAIAAVTVLLLLYEPFEFKVVYDEVILSVTAQMLHFDRLAGMPQAANDLDGPYMVLNALLDKRPLVFPFLLASVHDLTGFRYGNVFLLNSLLTLILVTLIYILGRVFAGHRGGLLAVLLAGTLPLLSIFASSGHFEVLNLVMICVVVLLSHLYLQRPSSTRLVPLVYALVILSQVRYENSLYVLPFGILILIGWRKAGQVLLPWQVVISPLFFMLYAMHYRLILRSGVNAFQEGPNGRQDTFSLSYAVDNLTAAANYLFAISQQGAKVASEYGSNSYLLAVLGLSSVFVFCAHALRNGRRLSGRDTRGTTMLYLFFSIALFCVVIAFFNFGMFDIYITSRLSLPLWLLFILLTPFILQRYRRRYVDLCLAMALICGVLAFQIMTPAGVLRSGIKFGIALVALIAVLYWIRTFARRPTRAFLLLPLACIVTVGMPTGHSHRYSQDYKSNDIARLELEFLSAAKKKERVLWVTTAPYTALLTRSDCQSVAHANKNPETLLGYLNDRCYDSIYTPQMVEKAPDGTWKLGIHYDALDPEIYRLEKVFERMVDFGVLYQVYRVVEVRIPAEPKDSPPETAVKPAN